jgi:hypothetical protein
MYGERRVVYWVLVVKPEEKRPLGRPWHRWEDNITMDLQEVGCGGVDWIFIYIYINLFYMPHYNNVILHAMAFS